MKADILKTKKQAPQTPKPKKQDKPSKKHWVNDPDGTLGIAKSIASRFGIELVEEEFFDKKG